MPIIVPQRRAAEARRLTRVNLGGTIARALDYATAAHGDQRYGDRPYHHHLRQVMDACVDLGFHDREHLIAAALHDVVEDTPVSVEDIEARFGRPIAVAVGQLSRDKAVSASDYLAAMNALAFAVKLADRLANVRNLGRDAVGAGLEKHRVKLLPKYQAEMSRLWDRARQLGEPFERACAAVQAELDAAARRLGSSA